MRDDLPPKVRQAAEEFTDLIFENLATAVREKPLPDFFDHVLEHSGYLAWVQKDPDAKRRIANLRTLRAMTTRYENSSSGSSATVDAAHGRTEALGTFLADIAMLSASPGMRAVESGDPDASLSRDMKGVTLATIHAVKGLEFLVVFLCGLEEGIFPHAKAMKTAEGMEEETRLAYVAMTRAMSMLYLTYARSRIVGEEMKEHAPSRFLAAIPKQLTNVSSVIEQRFETRGGVLPIETEQTTLVLESQELNDTRERNRKREHAEVA